ncbi:MAG: twin-arginine translocation signal domain-containing protein [Flammeovirgaceae bacterium]
MGTRRSFLKKSFGIAGAASLATQAKVEDISEALCEQNQLTP